MCLVSLSKQLPQRKKFLALGKFWSKDMAIYNPRASCDKSLPTGICWMEAISSFIYTGKLLSLERLSATANLGWMRAGDLVIWVSISHSPESFNPLTVSSCKNLSFWAFHQRELEGAGSMQSISLNTLGIPAWHISFFSSQRVCTKARDLESFEHHKNCQHCFLCLRCLACWHVLLSISSNTEKLHLSVYCGTQAQGFQFSFLRSWADVSRASCYFNQPGDKC